MPKMEIALFLIPYLFGAPVASAIKGRGGGSEKLSVGVHVLPPRHPFESLSIRSQRSPLWLRKRPGTVRRLAKTGRNVGAAVDPRSNENDSKAKTVPSDSIKPRQFQTQTIPRRLSAMATATKNKPARKLNLQPLGDRLVVQRDESDDVTTGGIILPDNARDKPVRGIVLSVGEGRMLKNGTRAPLQVKEGDRILFTSYGPEEMKIGDRELLLMREDDVLAIID
jgi:chaperonin GroES